MSKRFLGIRPTTVFVGPDQAQHIELTRKIARKIGIQSNSEYSISKASAAQPVGNARIMDLRSPLLKMSKSSNVQQSCIFLTDSDRDIADKIMKATTTKEGISNLITLASFFSSKAASDFYAQYRFEEECLAFKRDLIALLVGFIAPIRAGSSALSDDEVLRILQKNEQDVRLIAESNHGRIAAALG